VNPESKKDPNGRTMKALAWFGVQDVRLVDVPIPDITEEDDVIVKVTGTTICGSDLHLYHGQIQTMQKGDILGHEFMGIVEKVGSNVKKVKVGQRVVASFYIACGECRYCKEGFYTCCDNTNNSTLMNYLYGTRIAGIFGYSHLTGGFAGGQAEYVRVPKANVNLLPVPDDLHDEQALYLSDIVPTSYHCVVDTGVKAGDVVGIWGLGPIGMCVAKWCQLKGATRVIGIDRVPERLQFARNKLGIEILDYNQDKDVPKKLLEMVPGGLDVGLYCASSREPKSWAHTIQLAMNLETDVPEVINEAIVAVKKRGRVGLIGDEIGYCNGFNIGALMEKGIRLIGNGQAPVARYWEEIIKDYIRTGKFDPKFIITHRVPFEDMPNLYKAFDKKESGVEKVFVETKFSRPPTVGYPTTTRVEEWDHLK
jgi:threonine dehydrogenase-like Zn-dependent dehydrogenase